ncbi:SCAN domain-containing protein 3 [Trichonephila clavata]|uniref:SCAN domain-containing protein 3 n=1 Tax=Trichonephila clavata TaxID=2740835 RepID=A0A8X6L4P4_TRICU|nr:SCAN domain-containing protein 3 [Trichonephila clavata]
MPLSNSTASRRIDQMSEDIEMQLVEKLEIGKFSVQLDESTLSNSVCQAVLITYKRYVDKGHFAEEMLFCKLLQSTTTSKDIYNKLKTYLEANNIPVKNITSYAADGAPKMMKKKNGCLNFMRD